MAGLLTRVSPELRALLDKRATWHTYHPGQELFAVGEPAEFLPIIISGSVKMVQFPEVGKEVILEIFRAGQMFAVPPVIDGKNYPASATAIEKTRLMLLSRKDFFQLLEESSEFTIAVLEWMSEMLRQKTATIQTLAGGSPEQRISHVLLRLFESLGGEPPVKITVRREDIGKMAGLTTETTIRVVRRMKEKSLLRIDRGKIILDGTFGLKRLLNG